MVEDRFRGLLINVGASQTLGDAEFPGKLCHAFFGGDDQEDARCVASSVGAISTMLHWLKPGILHLIFLRDASHCLLKYIGRLESLCQKCLDHYKRMSVRSITWASTKHCRNFDSEITYPTGN